MGYKDVLHYLEGVIVDRIELDDFEVEWNASSEVTPLLTDENHTLYEYGLSLAGLVTNSKAYVSFSEPQRLDSRDTVELHLLADDDFEDGDLSLILSDDPSCTIINTSIDLPALVGGSAVKVELTIPNPENLNSIRSAGIVCNANTNNATLYVMALVGRSRKYVITVEELEKFEADDGLEFVLSKIGEETLPNNNSLQTAVYMAAGAYTWMYLNGQDTHSWDYGSKLATKNYAIRLLSDAESRCEEYMAGSDITKPKSVRVIGGAGFLGF